MALPLNIPASPVVQELCRSLDSDVPRSVLDRGCGVGRNALKLASLGHDVLAVSNNVSELKDLARTIEATSLGAGRCRPIAADARHHVFRTKFDIILANELLHTMTKPQSHDTVAAIQNMTKQGGVNVISGYVVNPLHVNAANRARCLGPDELRSLYDRPEWNIIFYEEDPFSKQNFGQKELINSLAKLIAVRNWR